MGDDKQAATFCLELAKHVFHQRRRVLIQSRCRLVEQQEGRSFDQRAYQRHPLPFSRGQEMRLHRELFRADCHKAHDVACRALIVEMVGNCGCPPAGVGGHEDDLAAPLRSRPGGLRLAIERNLAVMRIEIGDLAQQGGLADA